MYRKTKRLICLLMIGIMLISINISTYANDNYTINEEDLNNAYNDLREYTKTYNIPFNLTFERYLQEYYDLGYSSVEEYSRAYYNLLQPQIVGRSSWGSSKWYYNTGIKLPQSANYSKYNLLNTLQAGDIIYEAKGGFGITGHTAIVEGKYYDSIQKQYYIRIIEAIDKGVVRSVLDDDRVADKDVHIYRVTSATSSQDLNVVSFCIRQLGKSYSLDFAKNTSTNEKDWYCSELVWAAYYNQGINIETTNLINEPGITPRDIANSLKLSSVYFK